jgi:hypothetical protein
MKRLASLIVCCFVGPCLYCQQTADFNVAIIVDDESSISLQLSDLKAEVDHQPVAVTSITPLAGKCLQYSLLNDASKSNRWPDGIKQQTDAADQLLKQVVAGSSDVGSLINFNDEVYIDAQNLNNTQKLASKLERRGSGGTVTYDAVYSSVQFLAKQSALPNCRKVVFLFGDGEDNTSHVSLSETTRLLERTGIPMFIIAPSTTEKKKEGENLRQLASLSGGRVYFLPRDTRHVTFDLLKRDLAQSFLLRMAGPLPESHELLPVTITDVSNPRVRIIAPSHITVSF